MRDKKKVFSDINTSFVKYFLLILLIIYCNWTGIFKKIINAYKKRGFFSKQLNFKQTVIKGKIYNFWLMESKKNFS
jgi:hypothetical protein